jgi:hypothetical protein
MKMYTETAAMAALAQLSRAGFIGAAQRSAIKTGFASEEKQFFFDKIGDLSDAIQSMPKTYDQDGLGQQAVAHLHYFVGGCDWYITEKDMLAEQRQAFGLADLGYGGELGYIWLGEITAAGAEIDLYWTPTTLSTIGKTTGA